jgi:hypothetical protein
MKARTESSSLTLGFLIICSLLGWLILIVMMTTTSTSAEGYLWRKPFVGSLFFLICTSGSMVAVSPRRCVATHSAGTAETSEKLHIKVDGFVSSEGHHPNCGKFSDHKIQFKGTSYCAACTGLFVGAVTAMSITVLYFFLGFDVKLLSFPAVLVGQLGFALGLLQFKFKGWTRFGANLMFVVGNCLMLIGVDELVHSVFVDVYMIGLVLLWILTRVMISQWDHYSICLACGFSCKKEGKVAASAPSA